MGKLNMKFRVNLGFSGYANSFEQSCNLNAGLNNGFRDYYMTKRIFFGDIFERICFQQNFKDDKFNIDITFAARNWFYKRSMPPELANNYYFESKPLMSRVPYFQYFYVMDFQDILQHEIYEDRLCVITNIACDILRQMAAKELWNVESVDKIQNEMIGLIRNKQEMLLFNKPPRRIRSKPIRLG